MILLAISLLVRPINHDEGQYVAATALMRIGWPYVDFAYLQTPLQPLLLAPLSALPAGWLLLASRIVNALFACLVIVLLLLALRGQAPRWAALVAAAALACTDVFLHAGSLARNDALPLALLSGAVMFLLQAQRLGQWSFGAAGLMLGLAASAKISFALSGAAAGLFLLWQARTWGWRPLLLAAAGGMVGMLPTAALAVAAPEEFYFGVFTYSLEAPQQWWASIGEAERLGAAAKILRLLKYSAVGSILIALVIVALHRRRSPAALLLDSMIVGGLVAAYLPDPAFRHYLAPLLPPLFARFAIALGDVAPARSKPVYALTFVACIAGLAPTATNAAKALQHGVEIDDAIEQGEIVAELAAGGAIATLAPERIAGSDTRLLSGFVTGPFLFRTQGKLAQQALDLGGSPNWARLRLLDRQPPAAILVGGETEPKLPRHRNGLDGHLIRWARSHGYRQVALSQGFRLFLAPKRRRDSQGGRATIASS